MNCGNEPKLDTMLEEATVLIGNGPWVTGDKVNWQGVTDVRDETGSYRVLVYTPISVAKTFYYLELTDSGSAATFRCDEAPAAKQFRQMIPWGHHDPSGAHAAIKMAVAISLWRERRPVKGKRSLLFRRDGQVDIVDGHRNIVRSFDSSTAMVRCLNSVSSLVWEKFSDDAENDGYRAGEGYQYEIEQRLRRNIQTWFAYFETAMLGDPYGYNTLEKAKQACECHWNSTVAD